MHNSLSRNTPFELYECTAMTNEKVLNIQAVKSFQKGFSSNYKEIKYFINYCNLTLYIHNHKYIPSKFLHKNILGCVGTLEQVKSIACIYWGGRGGERQREKMI